MNVEGFCADDDTDGERDRLDEPLFHHDKKLARLERQLYGHVLAAIDLDAISSHEHHVTMLLIEQFALPDDLAFDLSRQLMTSALHRVITDPARDANLGPPDGITPEEAAAVAFDETCPFCLAARESDARRQTAARAGTGGGDVDDDDCDDNDDDDDDEPCECCEMLAREWRREHAATLAKAGLWPRPTAEPS